MIVQNPWIAFHVNTIILYAATLRFTVWNQVISGQLLEHDVMVISGRENYVIKDSLSPV